CDTILLTGCAGRTITLQDRGPQGSPSNHLLRLVVGLAVAAHRRGLCAGIELLDAGRDLRVLALEQPVAGEIALHQEWPEILPAEHPHGLREAELIEPEDAGNTPDAAPEQRAGAVADRGEIDRRVRHEIFAVDLTGHAAFADDDVAAGEPEPA